MGRYGEVDFWPCGEAFGGDSLFLEVSMCVVCYWFGIVFW